VKLGLEMGDAFGRGLLGAGGKMLKDSSVRLTIGGHRPTAACALGAALRSATHINKVRVGRFDMQLDRLRRGGSLDLSGSKVGDLDLMVLAGFLTLAVADGIKLHTLKLARTRVGREGVLPLVRIPSLTRLDISGNKSFRAAGMRALGNELLASGTSRLGSLKCDAFDVPESATELKLSGLESGAVVLLAGVVKLNVSIEEVNLDGLSLPIKKLKGSDPVASLDFSRKGLSSASAIVIACLIRDNASVTSVNLLRNEFDTEAASMLLKVKEQKPMLRTLCGLTHAETELNYQYNGLGPADAMLLAPELQVMPSLTSVNLASNFLYAKGAKILAPAIRDSPSLTKVNLDGFDLPIKELKGTNPVNSLNFSKKGLGPASAIVIAALISDNASLTQLNARDNDIDRKGKAALRKAAKKRAGFELLL